MIVGHEAKKKQAVCDEQVSYLYEVIMKAIAYNSTMEETGTANPTSHCKFYGVRLCTHALKINPLASIHLLT